MRVVVIGNMPDGGIYDNTGVVIVIIRHGNGIGCHILCLRIGIDDTPIGKGEHFSAVQIILVFCCVVIQVSDHRVIQAVVDGKNYLAGLDYSSILR